MELLVKEHGGGLPPQYYKLTPDSCGAARTQMMCLVNDEGEVMSIVLDLLVVALQKEAIARTRIWPRS